MEVWKDIKGTNGKFQFSNLGGLRKVKNSKPCKPGFTKRKGCVYFVKIVGLKPIKIGFSTKDTPFHRLKDYETYAPFGIELIGFVEIERPQSHEKMIHRDLSEKRLKNEWFDISKEEAIKQIKSLEKLSAYYEQDN
jgi:hypothetical protein